MSLDAASFGILGRICRGPAGDGDPCAQVQVLARIIFIDLALQIAGQRDPRRYLLSLPAPQCRLPLCRRRSPAQCC
jgi:hypothetical protein